MRSRSLRVVAVCVALLSLMQGCRRDAGKSATAEGPRLAFISNNSFEFWTFAQKGAEKAGKDFGVIVEFKMPPNGKAEEQQQFIEDLLVKGVKGIAISPNDAKNMSGFLARVGKKVPLLTVDSDIPDESARRGYLGTHNYRAGQAVGDLVAKAVPGGGEIVIFVGTMDATNAVERRQGVLDFLAGLDQKEMTSMTPADATNLKVGKYTLLATRTDDKKPEACQQMCEDTLTKNPNVKAVIGLWAYNPPALLRAVEKMKSKAVIVGFDEDDDTLVGIKEGKIAGSVVQAPYEFGHLSMKILAGLAKGDEDALKKYPGIESGNRIFIPHRVINRDNVDVFRAEVKTLLGK